MSLLALTMKLEYYYCYLADEESDVCQVSKPNLSWK